MGWMMRPAGSLVGVGPLVGLCVTSIRPQARVLQAGIHTLHSRMFITDTHSTPALTSTQPQWHHNVRWRTNWLREYSSWRQQHDIIAQHRAPKFTGVMRKVIGCGPKLMSSGRDFIVPSVFQTLTREESGWRDEPGEGTHANTLHQANSNHACGDVMSQSNREKITPGNLRYNSDSRSGSDREVVEEEGKGVNFEALVELEVELSRQEGRQVPSSFTSAQWQELLTKKSSSARRKYTTFLFKNEMKRLGDKKKKEERKQKMKKQWEEREKNKDPNQHIQYGLWNNSIFLRIQDQKMVQFYHSQCIQAMMFGQPLVFDLGFDEHMRSVERQNCAYQLQLLMSENRSHKEPYHLHLCNAPASSDTIIRFQRFVPQLLQPEFPMTVSAESYLESYPREQLVYLTPHCREEMTQYDHNAVYIVGGIVDKTCGEPLTLAKAKREGIHMQKLPLDRYLDWGSGSGKSLTLNHIVQILLDMKVTGDWNYALRHVPSRKLRTRTTQDEMEEKLRRKIKRTNTKIYRSGM
ncbi:hypothetical protein Pcinc_013040 [Petrolisthes cinctipes]|uniref:RNA (guanine-9-)-methyltransferase domain-containing protein 1 n=1 Tax=Petrolisthes cinctipes TaxID=88211 RepID=A0AAE1KSP2_PETCI|nr:hypothetical protein Pcinc_013040 [Petrolisthes cinctipes]